MGQCVRAKIEGDLDVPQRSESWHTREKYPYVSCGENEPGHVRVGATHEDGTSSNLGAPPTHGEQ